MSKQLTRKLMSGAGACMICCTAHAQSTSAAPAANASSSATSTGTPDLSAQGLQDIIVTATKRSEAVNRIPMSITAVSGSELIDHGLTSVADLTRVIPSFSATDTFQGVPFYTLRGVGFADVGLASSPAVTIYMDEIPLPFPSMSRLSMFDIERVEVLKGPQGTLFGNNATGGAINYVAAHPTNELSAGTDLSFGTFNTFQGDAFVSGPLTSTLKGRISVKATDSSDWQYNYTRKDSLGAKRQYSGRVTLDWDPTDRFSASLFGSGWIDRSDSQAAQLVALTQLNLTACNPATGAYCIPAATSSVPVAPANDRAADWNANFNPRHKDSFYQISNRMTYKLTDTFSLLSITSYEKYNQNIHLDGDGVDTEEDQGNTIGSISSFFQELRLTGSFGEHGRVIAGGNYEHDTVHDDYEVMSSQTSSFNPLPIYGYNVPSNTKIRTAAVYGNVDYDILKNVTLHAGGRYTDVKTENGTCTQDSGRGDIAGIYNYIHTLLTGVTGNATAGNCVTFNADLVSGLITNVLQQHNFSWRVGLDYSPSRNTLLYANVSRGYKSGGFSPIPATTYVQDKPVTQESLLAYEAGFKLTLDNRRVQINGAGFYYDYANKQLDGRIIDPLGVFGALNALVNIPKSRIFGSEIQLTIRPIPIITASFSGTYLNSKVEGQFFNYDPFGNRIDFGGMSFPFTPKWSGNADIEAKPSLTEKLNAYGGVSVKFQSTTTSTFADPNLVGTIVGDPNGHPGVKLNPDLFNINAYALLDFRAGVASKDGRWHAGAYVRNATNKYYWNNVQHADDTTVRFTGMPRTVGVETAFKF